MTITSASSNKSVRRIGAGGDKDAEQTGKGDKTNGKGQRVFGAVQRAKVSEAAVQGAEAGCDGGGA